MTNNRDSIDGYVKAMSDGYRRVNGDPWSARGGAQPNSEDRARLRAALLAKATDGGTEWGVYSATYGFIPYDSEELARYIAADAQDNGHDVQPATRKIGPVQVWAEE